MPAETSRQAPASDAAHGLRIAFDLLLQDMALEPVDPATLPWDQPILVLRSAPMPRLQSLLAQIVAQRPAPALHILSHGRDEVAIRESAPCAVTFHAYPTPGRYRLEHVPADMLERLRSVRFGTLLYLDPGTSADLFGEAELIFSAIQDGGMVSVREDGTFARSTDAPRRRRAEAAFLRLVEWYQHRLERAAADAKGRT